VGGGRSGGRTPMDWSTRPLKLSDRIRLCMNDVHVGTGAIRPTLARDIPECASQTLSPSAIPITVRQRVVNDATAASCRWRISRQVCLDAMLSPMNVMKQRRREGHVGAEIFLK